MDGERALASIRKIDSVFPIEGADNIEAVKIQGWTVVVKKGEFKPGDMCVYCEIDSVLPDKPEFEFLREKKFRIKTIRLRGVISQGICFPISICDKGPSLDPEDAFTVFEGDDVTEIIGVKKWEEPISLTMGGEAKGNFHSSVPKTDEERVQNLTSEIGFWRGIEFVLTEKIDGTSGTFVYDKNEFDVCSRRLMLKRPAVGGWLDIKPILYWDIAQRYELERKMTEFKQKKGFYFATQGEIVGPGIQKNRLALQKVELFLFNAFNIDEQRYFDYDELNEVADFLGVKTVPVIRDSFWLGNATVDEIIKMADGESLLMGLKGLREGIVFRSKKNHFNLNQFGKVSFKSISNEYLLKYKI